MAKATTETKPRDERDDEDTAQEADQREAPPTAFPVWLYHVDGRKQQATNQDEVDALEALGFTLTDPNFQAYPKWVYHEDGNRQIVQTEADLEALGEGWSDTPPPPPDEKEIPRVKVELTSPEGLSAEHVGHYLRREAPPAGPRPGPSSTPGPSEPYGQPPSMMPTKPASGASEKPDKTR